MSQQVKLLSVSSAVPPNMINQRDVAKVAYDAFSARFDDFDRLVKVFESSGILRRYLVQPLDWYLQPLGWSERNSAYLEGACALFVAAAAKAMAAAGLAGDEVDTVVTVSSTGLATPGIDARVAETFGFRSDIERIPVFGLGCAGGVAGLGLGARLAQSRPGTIVLVVAVELCSVAFRMDKLTKENIVATALFGDGAAACVLRSGGGGLARVEMSGQHAWPGTLDIMGWSVDDTGRGVIFDLFARSDARSGPFGAVAGRRYCGSRFRGHSTADVCRTSAGTTGRCHARSSCTIAGKGCPDRRQQRRMDVDRIADSDCAPVRALCARRPSGTRKALVSRLKASTYHPYRCLLEVMCRNQRSCHRSSPLTRKS